MISPQCYNVDSLDYTFENNNFVIMLDQETIDRFSYIIFVYSLQYCILHTKKLSIFDFFFLLYQFCSNNRSYYFASVQRNLMTFPKIIVNHEQISLILYIFFFQGLINLFFSFQLIWKLITRIWILKYFPVFCCFF